MITLIKRSSVPVFDMLEPAKVVGNKVKTLAARTAYNHDSLVVGEL